MTNNQAVCKYCEREFATFREAELHEMACARLQQPKLNIPKDTLRLVVHWECNFDCPYCCNKKPEVRGAFKGLTLKEIDFAKYDVVCMTGGEPLLYPKDLAVVFAAIEQIPITEAPRVVLYTNGTLIDRLDRCWCVDAVNVGLHYEAAFPVIIKRVSKYLRGSGIQVRFQAEERYKYWQQIYPHLNWKFWKMNDCQRDNEEWVQ